MKRNVKNWIALLLAGGMLMGMTGCLDVDDWTEQQGEMMWDNTAETEDDVDETEDSSDETEDGGDEIESQITTDSGESNVPTLTPPEPNLPETSEQPSAIEKRILTVTVDGIIDQGSQKVIVLSFDNQTGSDVRFFSADSECTLQVTTDLGVYDTTIGSERPLSTGKSYRTITTEYAPGEVQQVALTLMKASFDAITNVEIYNAESAVSAAICDFASGSFSRGVSGNASIKTYEPKLQPQTGAILIRVDGIIDQGSSKTIALHLDNRTGHQVNWAWAKTAYLIVTTDAGVYSQAIEYSPIAIGTGYVTFTLDGCPGKVLNVTLSDLCMLKDNGLPQDRFTNITIFDVSANVSEILCTKR